MYNIFRSNTIKFANYATIPILYNQSCRSSIGKHTSYIAEILGTNKFFNLLSGQPFEIPQSIDVLRQICLSCHYSSLHEEGSLARLFFVWVDDVVTDWSVSYNPGVHVDTGCLNEDTFCCLFPQPLAFIPIPNPINGTNLM